MGLSYFEALTEAMTSLSRRPKTVFIGQGVGVAGTTMTDTLSGVPPEKLLEFPVAEDLQMGFAIGMALEGWLPICIFPRWNFLLLAANQLVNHLDRLASYSCGAFNPLVLIRTAVPIVSPFYPGEQHDDDFTQAFADMLRNVRVIRLTTPDAVIREYRIAATHPRPTLLVEHTALYKAIPTGVKAVHAVAD